MLVAACVSLAAGCGSSNSGDSNACGSPIVGSCLDEMALFCAEYGRLTPDASTLVRAACTETGAATWRTGEGCPHAGALGACVSPPSSENTCVAQWFYWGPVGDAQASCHNIGGIWVNP